MMNNIKRTRNEGVFTLVCCECLRRKNVGWFSDGKRFKCDDCESVLDNSQMYFVQAIRSDLSHHIME